MINNKFQNKRKNKPTFKKGNCFYCLEKTEPDFLNTDVLSKFTSERGKILSRDKTNICQKHQKALAKAVKRARHLSLLPFLSR